MNTRILRLPRYLVCVAIAVGCNSAPRPEAESSAMYASPAAEATSLSGAPLPAPPMTAEARAKHEKNLAVAKAAYDKKPQDPDAIIWLGRRLAYLGRFRESIATFSEGIRKHPGDARMYRHRGHRSITLREFDNAIRDLEKATALVRGKPDQIEPDGIPNERNIPVGSLQSNICYHLGLAHYLKGDFQRALPVWKKCHKLSTNPDGLVSTGHWLYMTLRRLGRTDEARRMLEPMSPGMDIIENASYESLIMMYGGEADPEQLSTKDPATIDGATILYGVGNWYLYNGEPEKAEAIFRRILAGGQWAAFGYIAAEAELERMGREK